MTVTARPRVSIAVESLLLAGRLLTQWRREPMVLIQALLYPTFLLITFKLLVGKSIVRMTGTDSLYGLVPMCAIAGAMFGAFAASFTLQVERDYGLLGRMWVLPVHRASLLTGRLLAEVARTLVGAVLITGVGIALGLRFQGCWLAVIPFILVPVITGVVFSMAVIAIAIRAKSSAALVWLMVPSAGAVFTSSGVAPVMVPGWLGPVIHMNPLALPIQAMRALALGDPAMRPLLLSLIWALALAAVLGPLAVRGYRTAAAAAR